MITIDKPIKLIAIEKALLTEVKERYKGAAGDRYPTATEGSTDRRTGSLQAAEYIFAERVQAIDALFTFATSSTQAECQRRVTAINAPIALCKK